VTVGIEEIKAGIRELSVDERRKVALYILELEKEHAKKTIGPQIAKDVDDVSKVVQDAFDKLKKFVKNG
jgi:hypothetical protein